MTENKAPAYWWYPRDHAADEHVQLMDLAEEGAYRRLLDHQWLHGSIPSDLAALARICKNTALRDMGKLWPAIEPLFHPTPDKPGRLVNNRLERIRQERKEYRERQSASGKKGAEARWGPSSASDGQASGEQDVGTIATPLATPVARTMATNGPASASASPSASAFAGPQSVGQSAVAPRRHHS